MATRPNPLKVPNPLMPPRHDIFISARLSEAMQEAVALKAALEMEGCSVFLIGEEPVANIAEAIASALSQCTLAVLLGTKAFGMRTESFLGTYQQLQFIVHERKPYFLVKMCDRFEEPSPQFRLPTSTADYPWQPTTDAERSQVPPNLVEQIMNRLYNIDGIARTKAKNTAAVKQRASREKISAAVSALAGPDGVAYNGVMCVSVGPGGSGKTAMRLAMQGKPLPAVRESTRGGDQQHVVIRQGRMLAFDEIGHELTQVDRALLSQLQADEEDEARRANEAEVARLRELMAKSEYKGFTLADYETVPEQIHVDRHEPSVLTSRAEEFERGPLKDGVKDGVLITFFDMGGQPEFACIAAEFLRSNAIISVFSRADELYCNVTKRKSIIPGTRMLGIDELFIWLDAIVARTTSGPVLLVITHADQVSGAKALSVVSTAILERLNTQEHPIRSRLCNPPKSEMIFFAVDNTKGLRDDGMQAYRETVRDLAEKSTSALQRVPLKLLRLQDAISGLARAREPSKDTQAMTMLRAQYSTDEVQWITLVDFVLLYREVSVDTETTELEARTFLEFLNMMGVINYHNVPALADLIVINPTWLLKEVTRIIRRLDLHSLPIDKKLTTAAKESLYKQGILMPSALALLWGHLPTKVQVELLQLCIQDGLFVPIDSKNHLVPALLPSKVKRPRLDARMPTTTVHIAFYTGEQLLPAITAEQEYLKRRCSLPAGIFEQLLAGLMKLSFSSQTSPYEPVLSRRYAVLMLGSHMIEMQIDEATNTIEVRFRMASAIAMVHQVENVVNSVVTQRFLSLQYALLTRYRKGAFVAVEAVTAFCSQTIQARMVIDMKQYSRADIEKRFPGLVPQPNPKGYYHLFVSYRQEGDKEHTSAFVNAVSTFTLGTKGEAISYFYDVLSLKDGEQFDVAFMRALSNTHVVVPFITAAALRRMCALHSVNSKDNVLLEWWLTLTLYKAKQGKIKAIFPVMCGEINKCVEEPEISNLFAQLNKTPYVLPDKVNRPTMKALLDFVTNELKLKPDIVEPLTVRELIDELGRFNTSALCWKLLETEHGPATASGPLDRAIEKNGEVQQVFAKCAKKVVERLEEVESEGVSQPDDRRSLCCF